MTLRGALRACGDLIAWTVLFSAGINLLYLAPSLYMMQVYDRVLNTGGMMTLALMSAILVFALAVLALLDLTRARLAARLGLRLNRMVAPVISALGYRSAAPGSEQAYAQAARDFDTIRQVCTGPIVIAALDLPWTLVFVGVCFLLHPLIGVATLVGGGVLLVIALRHERALKPSIEEIAVVAPSYYRGQEGDRAAAETVRALGMRSVLIERQLARRDQFVAAQTRSAFVQSSYGALSRFWRMVLQSAVLGLGAFLAVERQISPGALIAGSILAARALAPLDQIVGGWRQVEQARIAFRNLVRLIDDGPIEPQRTALPAPTGAVSFENVVIRTPDNTRLALSRINFTMAPGELIAVVGPSGAGKSTLSRAAVGAIAPSAGVVRLDGASLADWDPDRLGRFVGYLPQDVSLLAGTVGENIRRFAPASDEADAMTVAAAQAAGAHDMILRLPNAYDTPISAGGRGLSYGQIQRVGLARALYGDPVLLVLDEPNAHLDADGEVALVRAVTQAKARGAAVLLVAHRTGVIAAANRVMVLNNGVMEQLGPRDEVSRALARSTPAANVAQIRGDAP